MRDATRRTARRAAATWSLNASTLCTKLGTSSTSLRSRIGHTPFFKAQAVAQALFWKVLQSSLKTARGEEGDAASTPRCVFLRPVLAEHDVCGHLEEKDAGAPIIPARVFAEACSALDVAVTSQPRNTYDEVLGERSSRNPAQVSPEGCRIPLGPWDHGALWFLRPWSTVPRLRSLARRGFPLYVRGWP